MAGIELDELFSIKDKVVIISGTGGGIGKYLQIMMTKLGAIVYGLDKKFEPKDLENPRNIVCDITNISSLESVFETIFTKHKKIDVLINNAGVTFSNPSIQDWETTIKINLTGSFYCSKIASQYMMKLKTGSIINITSINAELGFPNNPAYVAAKGGLKMLGKAFAKDYGQYGIRVNNLGPGYIKTDMTINSYNDEKKKLAREKHTLLKRWGTLDDLLGPCIFLSSDASSYVTGHDLYVDGGWLTNGLNEEK